MSDWPQTRSALTDAAPLGVLSTYGPHCPAGMYSMQGRFNTGGAVWGTANSALYIPVLLTETVTVYQMSIEVTATAAGNVDVGIYDEGPQTGSGMTRLVSAGSTAIGGVGLQAFNIADTTLTPGTYYLAMNCSTITTAAFRRVNSGGGEQRQFGMREQAVGAVALPATASTGNVAGSYLPIITAHLTATAP